MNLYIDIEKKLKNFTLRVKLDSDKKVTGFLGQSGCGKSMTLKCIAGLETPDKGKIILNGKVLFNSDKNINLKPQERNVGFLFQNYALFPHMTVMDNIKIGLNNLKNSNKNELCTQYIHRLNLNGLEKSYPWQLSGGQQQRVALARVLVKKPDILLLDEPFSALDYHLRYSMEIELKETLKSYEGQVLFVTHDIEEAYRICEDIIVYDNGTTQDKRNKKELFENPKSLNGAKLTGFRNISRVKHITDNKFYAIDWGIIVELNTNNRDIKYICIREHNIKIIEADIYNKENTYKLKVINIIENPFSYTVELKELDKEVNNSIFIKLDKGYEEYIKNKYIEVVFLKEYICYF
ncbi:MAG: sulfate/molybdate ABC transporter ATP-binding protein [Paraclostridium sp.]